MALNSVNTNTGALVALQNLNSTNAELSQVQSRINTGKKVASAKDNGAVWAIAQSQTATSKSLNAVKDSLQRAQSTIDVSVAAGESVSDLLSQPVVSSSLAPRTSSAMATGSFGQPDSSSAGALGLPSVSGPSSIAPLRRS